MRYFVTKDTSDGGKIVVITTEYTEQELAEVIANEFPDTEDVRVVANVIPKPSL